MDVETQYECGLNLKATELRLGLPGVDDLDQKQKSPIVRCNKRASMHKTKDDCGSSNRSTSGDRSAKQQVVGWPPVQSHRKNNIHLNKMGSLGASGNGTYIKVSMDGIPYLRKTNLEEYKGYPELLKALMKMFNCSIGQYSESGGYNGSEYIPAYEDKEGDWMLVGDVPFEMFISSCKKLKLFKGSKAKGLTLFP